VRLPNVENAVVEDLKLSGYLLAFDHPEAAGKAEFFIERDLPSRLFPPSRML
jgi:hypothetical protein